MKTWRSVLSDSCVERVTRSGKAKGVSFLPLASSVWTDEARRKTFADCYKRLRETGELLKKAKSRAATLPAVERRKLASKIQAASRAKAAKGSVPIPSWTLEYWARSMLYDTAHHGFPSLRTLRKYSEGAAVAPGAIFLALCGHPAAKTDRLLRDRARPLALFCYLVRLARDLEADGRAGVCNMPEDLLHQVGLDASRLFSVLRAAHPPEPLRALMGRLRAWSLRRQRETRLMFQADLPLLAPDAAFSLELVFALYSLVLELMKPGGGDFRTKSLTPGQDSIEAAIQKLLDSPCPECFAK